MKPTFLAMDLEGTLISNAVSQIARPGLLTFLEYVRLEFNHLVIFTTVPEPLARKICSLLVAEGVAPTWFAQLPYVNWHGSTKDLRFVTPDPTQALLLDDHGPYVHPGQQGSWIEVPLFVSPYADNDKGLELARLRIDERLAALSREH
ncbi:NIF family HAD-type phosphatase [Stenotrophomonas maltophilia]|uniref:NIF family HAD-type phosphatase n=1 Tax=Stenotrophomonas maltophilia TaxID=40324 RepID=UPI002E76ECA2|nr:NIF family HAD-type phosphatase [Stenotrophomonas maltophilia]